MVAASADVVICQLMWGLEELVITEAKTEAMEERTRGRTPRREGGLVRCTTCKSSGSSHQVARACDQHPQHEVDDSSQATNATSPSRPANDGSVKQ